MKNGLFTRKWNKNFLEEKKLSHESMSVTEENDIVHLVAGFEGQNILQDLSVKS